LRRDRDEIETGSRRHRKGSEEQERRSGRIESEPRAIEKVVQHDGEEAAVGLTVLRCGAMYRVADLKTLLYSTNTWPPLTFM